jgi:RHS repeat-associated protein
MLAMTSSVWGNETRTYNSLNQLTYLSNINVSASYNYTAGSDNGKVASAAIGGETVTYQYDSLNRLISAAGSSGWGDSYGYDSFGNLLSKTVTAGSAPTLSVWVNTPTNQLGEYTYDANGNQLTGLSSQYFTYDSENRMIGAYTNGSDYVQYAYDSQNKRVFSSPYASGSQGPQHVYFYGVDGQQLGAYPLNSGASALEIATYFGSKRLGFNTNPNNGSETATAPDRLGSYGQYYPWGESKSGNNPADIWSYATYWRDSFTGLDYANQRYYSNVQGRFMTPDPYAASGGPSDPQSWNRYAYTRGDPINRVDTAGTDDSDTGDLGADDCGPGWVTDPSLSGPCLTQVLNPNSESINTGGLVQNIDQNGFTLLQSQGVINGFTPVPGGFDITLTTGEAGAIGICLADPVCAAVGAAGLIAIYVTAAYGPALIQAVESVFQYKKSDPVSVPNTKISRNSAGFCQRPPQWKWEASGNAHGSTSGTHWHWLQWNLGDAATCTYYSIRRDGPNDPGPDYILVSGPISVLP